MKAWIVVANGSEANLYSSENLRTKNLQLIKELDHPESRVKGNDLVSDRPGHYKTSHSSRGSYVSATKPKEVEVENFARLLANEIKTAHNKNEFEQLVLISSPHFYGLVNKSLDCSPNEFSHIAKDYTKLKPEQVLEKVREHLYG